MSLVLERSVVCTELIDRPQADGGAWVWRGWTGRTRGQIDWIRANWWSCCGQTNLWPSSSFYRWSHSDGLKSRDIWVWSCWLFCTICVRRPSLWCNPLDSNSWGSARTAGPADRLTSLRTLLVLPALASLDLSPFWLQLGVRLKLDSKWSLLKRFVTKFWAFCQPEMKVAFLFWFKTFEACFNVEETRND